MIKLRLRRMGAKKQPSYRIVAAESRKPRDGRFIEIVGHYDPKTNPYTLSVNEERAKYWLENGAQPSDTVRALLVKSGVLPESESVGAMAAKSSGGKKAGQAAAAPQATAEPEPAVEEAEAPAEDVAEEESSQETESAEEESN